jgi:hypothetical protein
MLTGRKAFPAEDVTEAIAAVVRSEPDWAALPKAVPASIHRLLRRCLEKDARRRLDSAAVARLDLDEAASAEPTSSHVPVHPWQRPVPVAIAALAAVAGLAGGWALASVISARDSQGTPLPDAVAAQISAPPEAISAFYRGFALSPDGRTLAFAARDRSGRWQIWTRGLNAIAAQPVRGAEGGQYPFWSPDGAHIGFIASGALRRVPIAGGPVTTICALPRLDLSWWSAS